MRFAIVLAAAAGLAQTPDQDIRNTFTPRTDTHFQIPAFSSREAWETRAAYLRKQILSAAGLLPMPERTPLNPIYAGRIEQKDVTIEKIALETMPGYYLGGNLYRPRGKSGRLPAVLSPHGHWTYGRLENSDNNSIPTRSINLARMGFVVFTYDMVGYNDTVQTPHSFGGPREQLWSFGPLGLQLWNSIRALDFLESLPDVDPARIAMTGASGGGTQTFLLTAIDERIRYSAPVNMISAIMQGGSPCENAPSLRVGTNNVEIAMLAAPRPLMMVAATGDWTLNTPKEEFPAIQALYTLYGKPEAVESQQFHFPHNYNRTSREAVYSFFNKHLLNQDAKVEERSATIPKLQEMLVWHGRALPANALTYDQIFAQWIDGSRKQVAATRDRQTLRERMALALGTEFVLPVQVLGSGDNVILSRPKKGDRVPARLAGPASRILHIVVDPDGSAAAMQSTQVKGFLQAGERVLAIDAFQTGRAVVPRDRSGGYFLTFNRSDDANRVQDILTAISAAVLQGPQQIRLHGYGRAAVWCLFAAAVAEYPVALDADLGDFTGTDDDFIGKFFVPGIQRAGGLAVARMLAAN